MSYPRGTELLTRARSLPGSVLSFWRRSLRTRVVTAIVVLCAVVVGSVGFMVMRQITDGLVRSRVDASVAEAAGPRWSGKALGLQNTGQFLAASAVGPGVGALVTAVGYPSTMALVALAPLAALPLVPRHDEHR